MPVLSGRNSAKASVRLDWAQTAFPDVRSSALRTPLIQTCANPGCSSGWLQIWRSRSVPRFERGWTCSPDCTAQRVRAAVSRELDGRCAPVEAHRHRIPLGLLMLEHGWITKAQLRCALKMQRACGKGRFGQWLVTTAGVEEKLVTRALGLQWSCPVLPLEFHDAEGMSPLLPRLLIEAFGALPLRIAAGKVLYLGFEDRLDAALALALERMSGLRIESGLVQGSHFRPAYNRMLEARFPGVDLLEAASEPALVRALTRVIERMKPIESRLARVHDFLWLRLWRKPQAGPVPEACAIHDIVCTAA